MKEKKKSDKSSKKLSRKKAHDNEGTATPKIGKTPEFLPPS